MFDFFPSFASPPFFIIHAIILAFNSLHLIVYQVEHTKYCSITNGFYF